MRINAILFAAAAMVAIQPVHADVITMYNRAAFSTALAGGMVSGQNFDGLTAGSIISTVNGVSYSASLGNPVVTDAFLTTTPPNGLGSTSAGYFLGNETATIQFATPVTAFGIDVNTYAPTSGDYQAKLNDGATALSDFDVFPGNATGQFIGFTDSVPFTSVTISALTDPADGNQYPYTLDSLVYGNAAAITSSSSPSAVPEPSSFLLIGACAALCLLMPASKKYRA